MKEIDVEFTILDKVEDMSTSMREIDVEFIIHDRVPGEYHEGNAKLTTHDG